ncbi:MFS transporter [Bacillus sanguinis]
MYSYNLASTIVLLAVLRVIHGVTWAVSTTAVGTAITDIIPDSRRGEGMGWYGMAMTITMAIGPMIGLSVVQHYSFHGLFLLATLLSFMAVFFIFHDENAIYTTKKKKGKYNCLKSPFYPLRLLFSFYHLHMEGLRRFYRYLHRQLM